MLQESVYVGSCATWVSIVLVLLMRGIKEVRSRVNQRGQV